MASYNTIGKLLGIHPVTAKILNTTAEWKLKPHELILAAKVADLYYEDVFMSSGESCEFCGGHFGHHDDCPEFQG